MISTSTSQSNPMERNTPLPVDGRCLVVQMPSVEEMRREVADITCQMQSVYLDDETNLGSTEEISQTGSRKYSAENSSLLGSPRKKITTLGPRSPMLDRELGTGEIGPGQTKSNTIGRVAGISNEMVEAFPIQSSMSSSLPREEQVSEEFVINGKRYRQTYQRRVVLERKTTRDVFFLPASSSDAKPTSSGSKTLEYHSPSFTEPGVANGSLETHLSNLPETELDSRPRLDLTVLHKPSGTSNDHTCLTPAVIMRPVSNSPQKKATDSPCNGPHNGAETKHFAAPGSAFPLLSTEANAFTVFANLDNNRSENINRPKRSRSKYIVRDMVDAVKKQLTTNVRRTKSILTTREEQQLQKIRSNVNISLKQKESANSIANSQAVSAEDRKKPENKGRHELVGYMYKFGVWDDQAPVLDPRLPVAIRSSLLSREGLNGTVIANPPEWHHAEVGLNESGSGLVRGRVVACLQRFTQHSSASGKALHRSTYVQQTRLVRQRNQDKAPNDGQKSSIAVPENLTAKDKEQVFSETIPKDQTPSEANSKQTSVLLDSAHYMKCSSDRLQLLQSLCPAAAAATILLSRQFTTKPASLSDSDSDSSMKEERVNLGETRVLVSAHSWCPAPLISTDLTSYLVFVQAEQNSDSSQTTSNHKPTMDASSPLIRGGTLDGLLAYALRVLQDQTNAQHLNTLFPHVFRVTYPTFTTPERVTERLIQVYVAHAPIEPGCQSPDWSHSLTAAEFLVTIATELHPEQLTARLVLRLARFARLLILDGLTYAERNSQDEISKEDCPSETAPGRVSVKRSQHKILADRLFDSLPLLSASAQLRERAIQQSRHFDLRPRRNSSHVPRTTNHSSTAQLKSSGNLESTARTASTLKWPSNNLEITGSDSSRKSSLEACLELNNEDGSFTKALNRARRFTEASALALATELTRIEEEVFAQINFHEFLDVHRLERGEARTLSHCVEHFNQVTRWARSLLFVLAPKLTDSINSSHPSNGIKAVPPAVPCPSVPIAPAEDIESKSSIDNSSSNRSDLTVASRERHNYTCLPTPSIHQSEQKSARVKQLGCINLVFCHICEVLKYLKQLKNFSSFLALLLAVQEVPEVLLFKKSKMLLAKFSSYMKPPMFTEYRRDLEAASLPYLPYLGLIFQQLIHLHAGNPAFLVDIPVPLESNRLSTVESNNSHVLLGVMANSSNANEQFVNMWRCWKHYLILGYFIKRRENPDSSRHCLPCNKEIQEILHEFKDRFSDAVLDKAKEQLVANAKQKKSFWTNPF